MLRVVGAGLWDEIKRLGRKGGSKLAAIAYVTADAHLKFNEGDVLVCDASNSAISAGQTSAKILRAAWTRGAKIYSSPGLHAKVLALGPVAVVGSGNMSNASASTLNEAAIVTDDARALAGVRAFIHQLTSAADVVDERFLSRIDKIVVRPPRDGSKRKRAVDVGCARAWLVSLVPLKEHLHTDEAGLVESETKRAAKKIELADREPGYMRWTGPSSFRRQAQPGDLVIAIWRPHWQSKRGVVYAPEPLLHRRDDGAVTHFFVEEPADREDSAISFTKFSAIWRKLGSGMTPGLRSTKEVPAELAEILRQRWP